MVTVPRQVPVTQTVSSVMMAPQPTYSMPMQSYGYGYGYGMPTTTSYQQPGFGPTVGN